MLEIMDVMAEAYTKYRSDQTSGYSWDDDTFDVDWELSARSPSAEAKGLPRMGLPSLFDYLPQQPVAPLPPSKLEGWWLGKSGEILAFKRDHFRIYVGPYDYREGLFQIVDWKVAMMDPETKAVRQYDFALRSNYLALRDEEGMILYYIHVEP